MGVTQHYNQHVRDYNRNIWMQKMATAEYQYDRHVMEYRIHNYSYYFYLFNAFLGLPTENKKQCMAILHRYLIEYHKLKRKKKVRRNADWPV